MMSEAPLLEFKNVTHIFRVGGLISRRRIKAVDDVSFTIPSEKPMIKALVGESGSGKTTIARIILGLLEPTSGEVLYKGRRIKDWLKKEKTTYLREVQPIFQDPYSIYNPFYRVERVLKLALKKLAKKKSKKEIEDAIISAMRDTGKTSPVLSLFDGNKFKFMSDDLTILREDGMAFSYPTKVGISPFTLTGNVISYTGNRMKRLIARSQTLIFLLENFFNFELSERKEVPPELIEDEGMIEKVFILAGSGKEEMRKIDNSVAVRKILMTTAELLDPFRVYSINYYSFVFGLDTLKLFNREREIIEKAIADAECFELRANDIRKYPEMIKSKFGV